MTMPSSETYSFQREEELTEKSLAAEDITSATAAISQPSYSYRVLETASDTSSKALARSFATALCISTERLFHNGNEDQVFTANLVKLDKETQKVNQYVVDLYQQFAKFHEFQYQPGFDNPVRKSAVEAARRRGTDFFSAIPTVLRGAGHLISEDVQLELIDTLGEITGPEEQPVISHLMISLLRSQSDSIVDGAVNALANDALATEDAVQYLKQLEQRTKSGFLKRQIQETLDSLMGRNNGDLEISH